MGGTSTRNFKMFRKLCGDAALQNVIIVTNRWGEVDPQVGEAREAELIREDDFFKPVLDKGAQMARHENTILSAERIIRLILKNNPLPLQIQIELVKDGKDISETSAGEELNRELNAQIKKYKGEMRALKEEMRQATKDEDEETRTELEIEAQKTQKEIAMFENDVRRLASNYESEKERLETRITKRREEARREAEQYQRQVDELKEAIEASTTASEREKAEMREKLIERSRRRDRARQGFFALIAGALLGKFFGECCIA
jgi:chromosome segregation ATPase